MAYINRKKGACHKGYQVILRVCIDQLQVYGSGLVFALFFLDLAYWLNLEHKYYYKQPKQPK
jgi:hypothetical protein